MNMQNQPLEFDFNDDNGEEILNHFDFDAHLQEDQMMALRNKVDPQIIIADLEAKLIDKDTELA